MEDVCPVIHFTLPQTPTGEVPWDMFHTMAQQHSLRKLYIGDNKFDVTTLPSIVTTMTNIEELAFNGLGYTGVQFVFQCISRYTN